MPDDRDLLVPCEPDKVDRHDVLHPSEIGLALSLASQVQPIAGGLHDAQTGLEVDAPLLFVIVSGRLVGEVLAKLHKIPARALRSDLGLGDVHAAVFLTKRIQKQHT